MHLEDVPDRADVDAVAQLLVRRGVGLPGEGESIRETLEPGGLPRRDPAPPRADDVKSSNARSKIRQWLKKENKTENAEKGKEMLEKYVKRKGYDTQDILHNQWINKCAKALNYSTAEDLYTAISYGGVLLNKICGMLENYYKEEKAIELKRKEKKDSAEGIVNKKKNEGDTSSIGVSVKGVDNLLIRISKCCNPVPGDSIVGFITKGRGISVHRTDCVNMLTLPENEKSRLIETH